MSTAALVLAAGRGERLGAAAPKGFVELAGVPLIVHALEAIAGASEIERVIPVISAAEMERFAALAPRLRRIEKLAGPVAGGRERQDSVAAGLAAVPSGCEWVAVHDAARPLVRSRDVSRVVLTAWRSGAAILAIPVRDTVKRVQGGRVVATPPRSECFAAQTPQVFRCEVLREALAKAAADAFVGTDDAELVERLGVEIEVVDGSPRNLKITRPEDLAIAELWLRERSLRRRRGGEEDES